MPYLGYFSRALVALSLGLISTASAAEPYEAFIQKHCARCHGPDKEKEYNYL